MSYYSDLILAEAGLQSYWKLDEASGNVSDSKGSLTGTVAGTLTYAQTGAYVALGTGIKSDGSSGRISFGDVYDFNTGSFTVEFWMKWTSGTRIISKYEESTWGGWHLSVVSSKLYAQRWHPSATVNDVTGSTTLSTGTWYHVALTYDGTALKVYLNGSQDGTSNVTAGTLTDRSTPLLFGATSTTTGGAIGSFSASTIQHLAIYNTAKSAATLLTHYQAGPKVTTADSWAWTDTNETNRPRRTTSDAWAWSDTTSRGTPAARTAGTERTIWTTGDNGWNHYAFPTVTRIGPGKLIAVCRRGTSHSSYDGSIVSKTSNDDGATWGNEQVILDNATTGWDERDPKIVTLASGRLALTWGRRKQNGGYYNGDDPRYSYSDDNGATWSTPVACTAHNLSAATYPTSANGLVYGSDITELHNGDLLLSGYGVDGAGSGTFSLFIAKSTDGGATWSHVSRPARYATYSYNCVEPQIILLETGKLYMTWHLENGASATWYASTSTDNGATWSHTAVSSSTNRQGLSGIGYSGVIVSLYNSGGGSNYSYWESLNYGATFASNVTVASPPNGYGTWIMSIALAGTGAQQNIGFIYSGENLGQTTSTVKYRQFSGLDGVFVYARTTSDGWAWTDTNTHSLTYNRAASDSWAWSDTATRAAPKARTTSDSWALSDSNTRVPSKTRTTTDTWAWSDTSVPGRSQGRITFLDTWAWTDSATRTVSLIGVTHTRTSSDAWAWRDRGTQPISVAARIATPTSLSSSQFGNSTLSSSQFGNSTLTPAADHPVS